MEITKTDQKSKSMKLIAYTFNYMFHMKEK